MYQFNMMRNMIGFARVVNMSVEHNMFSEMIPFQQFLNSTLDVSLQFLMRQHFVDNSVSIGAIWINKSNLNIVKT